MKRFCLQVIMLLGLTGCWQTACAEEVEAMFLVAQLASGETVSMMLTNDAAAEAPLLRHKERLMVIGGTVYPTDDIVGLRLEKRMVDGIEEIYDSRFANGNPQGGSAMNGELPMENIPVYDLQGRRVDGQMLNSSSPQPLKKGIYIIHGRKVVVR